MSDTEDFDYQKPMSFTVWKKMFPFILPHKKMLFKCAVLMLSVALIDVLFPLLLGYAIRHNIEPRSVDGIIKILFAAITLMALQGINVRFFVELGIRIETGITKSLRDAVFFHLQKLGLSYYNKTPVGYMMARTNSDTSRIGDLVAWGLIDFCWSAFYCIGVIIAMFLVHWKLAIIVCLTIPPLALITWFFQKRLLKVNRVIRKLNSKMTGAMNEGITGAKTIKVLVAEEQSLKDYSQITGEYRYHANHMARLKSVFIPSVIFIGSFATAVVLSYGGWEILYLGADLALIAIFLQYAGSFFDPIQQIANILTDLFTTQANVERVSGLLEQNQAINESEDVLKKYGDNYSPKKENWEKLEGDIEFKDVSFCYPDGNENVFESFSLLVPKGTYVALVGETGSGKSTLVNLVCRFFEPNSGQILIDGRDYRERSQLWLHSSLGYVLQTPHLFTGTIRENIRYGKLEATDEEVEEAARIINAHETILKLEKGYETQVGEGGDKLSTGEKQLISFVRAVLANPRIFILDEATSSVDTEMEIVLQNAIRTLLKGRTSFVIAHRLSTIRSADIILVINKGKIIERGTHSSLMKSRGHYYELYTQQFEKETEEKVLKPELFPKLGRSESSQFRK